MPRRRSSKEQGAEDIRFVKGEVSARAELVKLVGARCAVFLLGRQGGYANYDPERVNRDV